MVFLDISQNLQENTWPRRATLLKKRLWHKCFPVTFIKFLRTPILQNTSGRLLLKLLTSWQNSLDRSEFVGSILVDLLKAYVKSHAIYCYLNFKITDSVKKVLRLFLNYLTNCTQIIKIGSRFSDRTNILKGIPRGFILSPLLFNVFINDLFFFSAKCEICNFADDNNLHFCGINLNNISSNLIQNMENVYKWFVYNSMKANLINANLLSSETHSHIHWKFVI